VAAGDASRVNARWVNHRDGGEPGLSNALLSRSSRPALAPPAIIKRCKRARLCSRAAAASGAKDGEEPGIGGGVESKSQRAERRLARGAQVSMDEFHAHPPKLAGWFPNGGASVSLPTRDAFHPFGRDGQRFHEADTP